MGVMPWNMQLSEEEQAELNKIREIAKVRHEQKRRTAARYGRKDFPDLPYECSWAFEQEFRKKKGK